MPLRREMRLQKPEKKTFDLLPSNVYEVVIEDIEERAEKSFENPGEFEDKLNFTFVIQEPEKYAKRKQWKSVTPMMFPSNKGGSLLYQIYSAVTGHTPKSEECELIGPDQINDLIGRPLRLHIAQEYNTKNVLVNKIKGYLPSNYADNEASVFDGDVPDIPTVQIESGDDVSGEEVRE